MVSRSGRLPVRIRAEAILLVSMPVAAYTIITQSREQLKRVSTLIVRVAVGQA